MLELLVAGLAHLCIDKILVRSRRGAYKMLNPATILDPDESWQCDLYLNAKMVYSNFKVMSKLIATTQLRSCGFS